MRGCVAVSLLLLVLPTVTCFHCWMCPVKPKAPRSLEECDAKRVKQQCPRGPGEEVTCGVFHYTDINSQRVHAKSCVYKRYCGDNTTFCSEILVGATDCYLECCHTELCNYDEPAGPDDDDDDDDCSWIDATGSTPVFSCSLVWACALCNMFAFKLKQQIGFA